MKPVFRCSSLDRALFCNGSIKLVPLVGPRLGDEGVLGTFLHWLTANRLKTELGAAGDIGPRPPMPPAAAFEQWVSNWCFREVKAICPPDWSLECEAALAYEFARFILSGHIDAVALNPEATEAIGWDYKTGRDPVDAAEFNDQVLGYIVLLLLAYPTLKKVTFYIVQPHNDEEGGFERVSKVEVTDLPAIAAHLEKRINSAIDNQMELNSSKKACRWCPVGAALQCPALWGDLQTMKITLTPDMIARVKQAPDDAQLGNWIVTMRTLGPPTETAEKLLHSRLDKQDEVVAGDGTRITRKIQNGSYSFPDPVAFYVATRKLITEDARYAQTVKPSVVKTKAMIAETLEVNATGKADVTADSVFDAYLAPLCKQGTKKLLQFT